MPTPLEFLMTTEVYQCAMRECLPDDELSEDLQKLAAVMTQPKRCADQMPPADARVLVWLPKNKDWFVAEWRPNAKSENSYIRPDEMENGATWVSDESDAAGETICYLPSKVTHWCELPGDPTK